MTEKYTGKAKDRRYEGEDVDITYSLKRCIHAKYCVDRLAEVFDVDKRPWIDANGASANRVADVIEMCPSGALHYDRKDGEAGEAVPDINRIIVHPNEYLQFIGDLEIHGANVEIEAETRASLCRCGASTNKPFCDNTHLKIDFETADLDVVKVDETSEQGGKLKITATPNGPLEVVGNLQIEDTSGNVIFTGTKTWLCRCGASNKKPFCDGTHNQIEFEAE